jgi:hypothetical protein
LIFSHFLQSSFYNFQCAHCCASAVNSIGDMRNIWTKVVEGMRAHLGLSLPCDLTSKLQLVDPPSMNRHSHVHQSRDSRLSCQCITGLTLSHKSLENGKEVSRGVTAIMMLRGLGLDMAHGVLAHECGECFDQSASLIRHVGTCTRTCTAIATRRSHPWSKKAFANLSLHCKTPFRHHPSSSLLCLLTRFAVTSLILRYNSLRTECRCSLSQAHTTSFAVHLTADTSQNMWRNTNPIYGGGFRAANAGLQVRSLNPCVVAPLTPSRGSVVLECCISS